MTEATSNQAGTRATLARERRGPAAPEQTMPTIQIDGIDFELALADGEVLDVRIDSREEFLEVHGDYFADPDDLDADPDPDDAEILSWARDHLSDCAQKLIYWPLWSQDARNGVSNRDFIGGAR